MLRGENTIPYSKFHTTDATDTTAPTWTGDIRDDALTRPRAG